MLIIRIHRGTMSESVPDWWQDLCDPLAHGLGETLHQNCQGLKVQDEKKVKSYATFYLYVADIFKVISKQF